jgi:hypothetical protein
MRVQPQHYAIERHHIVMPGLVPGIHVLLADPKEDVDGRDKPGHDAEENRGIP